ncbi:MAG: cytidine deaminase [Bdellovibrionaceae bacterium]|nr:cytidine deaminase [Pseudobdellovibrionaceae bacterium]MBX3033307.1 cytidine deaminase [Pseudobdellovibrionaceae bacterium]
MRNRKSLDPDVLFREAKKAQKNAHAPYSKHKIGAALRTANGRIFSGCNVENASYGGTVCAERVAVFKAVSEGLKGPITDICVISSQKDPWPPCGFCRQVLAEFATENTRIFLANPRGITKMFTLGELFPESFTPTHLK